jgi:hypothetical protein
MRNLLFIIAPLLVMTVLLGSCLKKETFPPEPSIKIKRLVTHPDSAKLVLSFQDGDGDIGLGQSDTAGDFRYNCFIDVYWKRNNNWELIEFFIPYYYRIPILSRNRERAIQGDIIIDLIDFPPDLGTTGTDTLKISVFIKDKALNKSNVVESDPFIVVN